MAAPRFLEERDPDARELMDAADADPQMLAKTYERFALVNAVVSGARDVYRRWVRPRLSPSWSSRLLDVGTGGGDLPRRMVRWAAADGLKLEAVGIDPDERAMSFAAARGAVPGLTFSALSSRALADADERFEFVVSNHVLHHLSGREFGALLADSERLTAAGGVAVHGDIERTRLGYAAFAAGTWPFARNLLAGSYIRPDGLTSIRRSHTAAELAPALPPGWHVRRAFPSRLEVVREDWP